VRVAETKGLAPSSSRRRVVGPHRRRVVSSHRRTQIMSIATKPWPHIHRPHIDPTKALPSKRYTMCSVGAGYRMAHGELRVDGGNLGIVRPPMR
jgi:hypothetical protein